MKFQISSYYVSWDTEDVIVAEEYIKRSLFSSNSCTDTTRLKHTYSQSASMNQLISVFIERARWFQELIDTLFSDNNYVHCRGHEVIWTMVRGASLDFLAASRRRVSQAKEPSLEKLRVRKKRFSSSLTKIGGIDPCSQVMREGCNW